MDPEQGFRAPAPPLPSPKPLPWHQGIKGVTHPRGSYSFREVTRGMWKS